MGLNTAQILTIPYNYTGKTQVSAITQKYVDAFAVINKKYSGLFNQLTDEMKKEKEHNEYMLLANKAMRNGENKLSRRYLVKAMNKGMSKSSLAYYVLSFTNFKTVLKVRKKLG